MRKIADELKDIANALNNEQNDDSKNNKKDDFDSAAELKSDLSKIQSLGGKPIGSLLKKNEVFQRLQASNPSIEILPNTPIKNLTVDDLQKILAALK